MSSGAGRIRVTHDGPYVIENVERLDDDLGRPIPVDSGAELCRCGGSQNKPFCDGTHARNGFSGAKDPKRVPYRRDAYEGVSVTVYDNRGICQHSGLCTGHLNTVFHSDSEPFVTASGGRMDEIVRAVRDCPSGALGFGVDGHEAREQVDWDGARPPAIEVSRDGPYRITGGIELVEDDGSPVPRALGSSEEHYALCRCGQSQNKPFCSGMHWYVQFRASAPRGAEPTLFEWAGGFPALLRMTRIFYEKYVSQDPLLGPLFAEMSPDHPQRVASWLGEVFGGPKEYSERYGGYARMISQHLGKALTEEKRARWVALLGQSANDAGLPADAEFRAAFSAYLEWGSRLALENSQPGAQPPPKMPMPRWWWVCDATPGSRASALGPLEPEAAAPIAAPAQGEAPSFERHVKGLFRERDRQSMKFAFDLWAYDDVKKNAAEILTRVRDGSMPCDGAWAPERVALFARWVESGLTP